MLFLTPIFAGSFHEPCQWLALVTHAGLRYSQVYLMGVMCSLSKPASMDNWCHFLLKSTQPCYNGKLDRNAVFTRLIQFLKNMWLNDPARAFMSGSVSVYHVMSMRAAIVCTIYLHECATLQKIGPFFRSRLFAWLQMLDDRIESHVLKAMTWVRWC